jgi:PhnB protein
MSFAPYLSFSGQAREAMTTYAAIFGATDLTMMPFGEAPPGTGPEGSENMIMHAQFSTGPAQLVMGADMPGNTATGMASASVYHGAASADAAAKVFAALSEGGYVILPLGETFWSSCFGMVKDRFGTTWLITLAA